MKAGNLETLLAAGANPIDLESWVQSNINGNLTALNDVEDDVEDTAIEEPVRDDETGLIVVLAWDSSGYTTWQSALSGAFPLHGTV